MDLHLRSYDNDAGERHRHNSFHQAVLALDGRLALEWDGHGGEVVCGQAAVIPAGCAHLFCGAGENRFLVLDLERDALTTLVGDARLTDRARFLAVDPQIEALATLTAAEIGTPHRRLARDGAGLLIAALAERYGGITEIDARLRGARAVMSARQGRIEVAAVAEAVGWSPSQLRRRYRAAFGVSPKDHLETLRLVWAARVLRCGRDSLAEIALDAGYSDQSAFSRAFRRRFGTAPGQYRGRSNGTA